MEERDLWKLGLATIKELETDQGILASGKEEIFGCIFGRDSLITSLELLRAFEKTSDNYFLVLVEKILTNLAKLQGQEINIESGEEPGKIIHEYRTKNHEHLTRRSENPWFIYPDETLKNYDSIDSTPLFLIAVAKYLKYVPSSADKFSVSVEKAVGWLMNNMKGDPRGFVSYEFHPERKYGGLATQSWMDSQESLFHEDGGEVPYAIAPVEAQAYTYLALRLWDQKDEARKLKENFATHFTSSESIPFALDGTGKQLSSLRSSIGHILWASYGGETIVERAEVEKIAKNLLSPEIFEPNAGIRTLSKLSNHFDPLSYHNGSIWPHDNAMIIEGLENFGFDAEAKQVREALKKSWQHFGTAIELFVYTDSFQEYLSAAGQRACLKQAWSAASMLSLFAATA